MTANLWDAFCETVEARGEKPAFVHGERVVTFGQWKRRAEEFASRLFRVGVRPGDRVLLWMTNDSDIAAAITGTWAIGGIVTVIDSSSPETHLLHSIDKVLPAALIFGPSHPPPSLPEGVALISTQDVAREELVSLPIASRLPTEPASIVFTSGSTGRPKGVTQSHGNLLRGCVAVASYLGLTPEDGILCPIPWSFDYGYGQLLSTVIRGTTLILPRQANPFGVCEAIEHARPTVLAGVPSLYTYLVRGVSPIRQTDCGSLRLLTSSGGTIPAPVLKDLRSIFSHCRISLNYGLTETYRTCTLNPELLETRGNSIGKPIPGVDVAIVRDDGTVAQPLEVGEIVHRGDYVCLGYWADPEATQRAIRSDPLAERGCVSPGRVLFTGDYGYRDEEGFIYFQGRRDHQLKSMGVRVSPIEIEELLYGSELVSEVAVFGITHDLLGQEVWAAVVPVNGHPDIRQELESYARRTMSPFMLPRRYIVKNELPRTTTRKIDYMALRAEAAATPSASLTR